MLFFKEEKLGSHNIQVVDQICEQKATLSADAHSRAKEMKNHRYGNFTAKKTSPALKRM